MAHFLEEAGFLHVRGVFEEDEMAAVGRDIDHFIARAAPDDGDSWWAEDREGRPQAVRVLEFYGKSEPLRNLVHSDRYQWLGELTGDRHCDRASEEGLVKPLGIVKGLSDLPWHKDCGQGRHSLMCNALTCGISITGADRVSGALGVVPGSHRANVKIPGRDPVMDMAPRMLETKRGDVTVHCSDTLHRAHPPHRTPAQGRLLRISTSTPARRRGDRRAALQPGGPGGSDRCRGSYRGCGPGSGLIRPSIRPPSTTSSDPLRPKGETVTMSPGTLFLEPTCPTGLANEDGSHATHSPPAV